VLPPPPSSSGTRHIDPSEQSIRPTPLSNISNLFDHIEAPPPLIELSAPPSVSDSPPVRSRSAELSSSSLFDAAPPPLLLDGEVPRKSHPSISADHHASSSDHRGDSGGHMPNKREHDEGHRASSNHHSRTDSHRHSHERHERRHSHEEPNHTHLHDDFPRGLKRSLDSISAPPSRPPPLSEIDCRFGRHCRYPLSIILLNLLPILTCARRSDCAYRHPDGREVDERNSNLPLAVTNAVAVPSEILMVSAPAMLNLDDLQGRAKPRDHSQQRPNSSESQRGSGLAYPSLVRKKWSPPAPPPKGFSTRK